MRLRTCVLLFLGIASWLALAPAAATSQYITFGAGGYRGYGYAPTRYYGGYPAYGYGDPYMVSGRLSDMPPYAGQLVPGMNAAAVGSPQPNQAELNRARARAAAGGYRIYGYNNDGYAFRRGGY